MQHDSVGQTRCLNLGQKLDGPLHYSLIELSFEGAKPALPVRIKVTAYPHQRSIVLEG